MQMHTTLVLAIVLALVGADTVLANPLNRLPKVIDGQGRSVGGFYEELPGAAPSEPSGHVLRREGGVVLKLLLVGDSELRGSYGSSADLLHTSTDCSGTQYLELRNRSLLTDTATVNGLPNVAVYPLGPNTPQLIASAEVAQPDPDCAGFGGTRLPNGLCCVPIEGGPTTINVAPASEVDLSLFVPPFRLK